MADWYQKIDDMSPYHPKTGLPKHVYDRHHPECKQPSIMGRFQMKGVKYTTQRYYYSSPEEREDAIEQAEEELEEIKLSVDYYEWLESGQYRQRVRKRARNEYRNSVHTKNNRSASTSMDNESRSGKRGVKIRHIGSVQ